jgi:hypothetical protein
MRQPPILNSLQTDTATIAASSGFIPIESSRPGSQKRAAAAAKDALEKVNAQIPQRIQIAMDNGKPSYNPAMHPQDGICAGIMAAISTTTPY